jgi:uncharacterized protein (TIGR01777 family)
MRIAIAGGTGYIGRSLTEELTRAGHEVVWLSRRPGGAEMRAPGSGPAGEVRFDHRDLSGPWADEIARADAVVNVSGFPISSRWNDRTKKLIRESRVPLTRGIVDACAAAREGGGGPEVLVNASGAGIYGDRGDDVLTEDEQPGDDWLARLAVEWEAEAFRAREYGMRVVTLRTSPVLGDEGALPRLVLPMKFFVGGPLGSGRQWFPWIHLADMIGLYRHALESDAVSGPVNAAAPDGVRMREFTKTLGAVLHRPSWLPVPQFALRLVVGEVAPSLLASQRVDPGKAQASGFEFRFPDLEGALRDILD